MGTLTLPVQRDTPASTPWRTGIALAVTVAVLYALCTLAWLVQHPVNSFLKDRV
jgi:hypothetical protein